MTMKQEHETMEPVSGAQDRLRTEILTGGLYESVSMADVQGYINRLRLATTDGERQQLMLEAIRSLLVDGLVVVGDIPGPNDPGFLVWPGGIDEVVAELTDRIIGQWTQPELWDYSTWLDLTQAGRAAAEQARGQ